MASLIVEVVKFFDSFRGVYLPQNIKQVKLKKLLIHIRILMTFQQIDNFVLYFCFYFNMSNKLYNRRVIFTNLTY